MKIHSHEVNDTILGNKKKIKCISILLSVFRDTAFLFGDFKKLVVIVLLVKERAQQSLQMGHDCHLKWF